MTTEKTNTLIYLDCHATTPVDPRVLDVMMPALKDQYGNPSSANHLLGIGAKNRVENARKQLASLLQCSSEEVIFTSGATEANNLAIKGLVEVYQEKGKHLITQVTEHRSVLDVFKYLEKHGFKVAYLDVDQYGQVALEDLKKAITDETILISVMFANNEIGTLQPIQEIGQVAREAGVFFHVDAAQALGKIKIDVNALNIDLLSCSAHKLYGPKGVGALYVRKTNPRVRLRPLFHGGGHENGLRSGTLNVPGIMGFGEACEISYGEMEQEEAKILKLREHFYQQLQEGLQGIDLHGHPTQRLYNNLNLSFQGVDGEMLLKRLSEKMAVSTGSACITMESEPSYVLKAIGKSEEQIQTSIRFGLGRFNTHEDIMSAADHIINVVKDLRKAHPFQSVAVQQ